MSSSARSFLSLQAGLHSSSYQKIISSSLANSFSPISLRIWGLFFGPFCLSIGLISALSLIYEKEYVLKIGASQTPEVAKISLTALDMGFNQLVAERYERRLDIISRFCD